MHSFSLQVTVTQKSRVKNTIDEFRVGKLFMIDLAGSERAAQTKVSSPKLDIEILPIDFQTFLPMLVLRISCLLVLDLFSFGKEATTLFISRIVAKG